jgi:dihydrofolate reductase
MELTATTMISLDGVTQAPGAREEDQTGGFELGGWAIPHFEGEAVNHVGAIFDRADAFLLGRRTYEIFAGYWPTQGEDGPIATALNRLPKHVASTTLSQDDLTWAGSSLLEGDVVEAVAALKRKPGRELQVHGSIKLLQSLLAAGLVDRLHLHVIPVSLGSGARLFEGPVPPTAFRLEEASTTRTGVQLLTYVPAGAMVPGHFTDLEGA